MRKRTQIFLSLAMVVGLMAGCGGGKKEVTEGATKPATSEQATKGTPAPQATATIQGVVSLVGKPPALPELQMAADPVCQKAHGATSPDPAISVKDGKLQNVFVYVKKGAEKWSFPAPTTPAVVDQQGCLYHPRVLGVMEGQPIQILNSDATLHNVHGMGSANPEFNLGMPTKGMKQEETLKNPEVMYTLKCDVHPWMHGYIGILKNPYFAVSGADGSFSLKVPAGTYTLQAWHEKFGTKEVQVTVQDGETKTVSFSFEASAAS